MTALNIELTGEIAVVTGVLGRLGAVWTDALLGAGAKVLGLDIHGELSAELAETLNRHGGERFVLAKADITDRLSLGAALELCLAELGRPAILVNNAGIDQPPSATTGSWTFEDIPDERSAAVLDVNLHGTLRACQVFGAELARNGRGSVVNIGSLYGSMAPDPRLYEHLPLDPPFLKPPAYGMSKAGVSALTRYLAALWGPRGVRVNTLSPGGVLGGQDPEFRRKFSAKVPLQRMARHEDLAGPLLFLASNQSSYVTGTELQVDGGYVCW
ncbi:SDR family oxidoreductase [Nonomuraea endophytica]|uniref:NAD(P)-dependent dehydrogenase (Short-subunit alcohol dehydrogenase family) n=1 Tax=Nonomuraea endophytica TaxID=714136 RepID=A0A7W8A1R1_9ACTN|nr:SDR family oxidoreductase [Nonomuraea endophytica]MBB5077977.1 NAD(P)-dependent dehydrogenase (short-subunit alcohol dehydrogenase family) [Nonomuraea endophytica]